MALTRIKTDQITDGEVKSADLDTDITLTGDLNVTDITMTGELNGPATFYIDPAPHDPDTDGATNGLVIIRGDLQVDGTTTTVNSTTMDVADLNITLASGAANAAAADGAGLTVDGASATLLYDGTNDLWQFNKGVKTDVGVTIATAAPSFVLQDAAGTYFHRLRLNASNSLIVERYDGTSTLSTLKLDETGDVGFYENNGGTPQVGMHWDYNDGRLGIGTDNPDANISVFTTDQLIARFASTNAGITGIRLQGYDTSADDTVFVDWFYDAENRKYGFGEGTSSGGLPINSGLSHADIVFDGGNVGIGTASPGAGLDIAYDGTAAALRVYNSQATNPYGLLVDNTAANFSDSNYIGDFRVSGGSKFKIMNNGRVGISDSTPSSQLVVSDGAQASTGISGGGTFIEVARTSGGDAGFIIQKNTSNWVMGIDNSDGNAAPLRFEYSPYGSQPLGLGSGTLALALAYSGNVGIGITEPSFSSINSVTSATKLLGLEIYNDGIDTASVLKLGADNGSGTKAFAQLGYSGANATAHFQNYNTAGTKVGEIVIGSGGNVGIGTDSPVYDLDVSGSGRFTTDLRIGSENLRLSTDGSGEFGLGYGSTHATANRLRIYQNTTPVFGVRDDGAIDTEQVRHSIRPSLNLDFANSKQLDPRITYRRSSIGTYYDDNGTLKYAAHNEPRFDHNPSTGESKGLLIESAATNEVTNTLDVDSYWAKTVSLLGVYSEVAPDGTYSAGVIYDNPTVDSHGVYKNFSVNTNTHYVLSGYFKKGTNRYVQIAWYYNQAEGGTDYPIVIFDLQDGTYNQTGGTDRGTQIHDVGNGWYRCSVTVLTAGSVSGSSYWFITTHNGTGAYAGDYDRCLYIWGLQFEVAQFPTSFIPSDTRFIGRSSSATYFDKDGILKTANVRQARHGYKYNGTKWIKTGFIREAQSTNVAHYSEDTDQWTMVRGTNSVDVTTSPDGYSNADKYTEGTSTGEHAVIKYANVTPGIWTLSVFAKAAGRTVFGIQMYRSGGEITGNPVAYFNLENGNINTQNGGVLSATSEYAGDDWWRISVTGEVTANATANCWMYTSNQTGDSGTYSAHTGDGSSGVYVWGVQLEQSVEPTSYIHTPTSADVTRSADVVTSVAGVRADEAAYVTGKNFDNFYKQSEGTLFFEASSIVDTDYAYNAFTLSLIPELLPENQSVSDSYIGLGNNMGYGSAAGNASSLTWYINDTGISGDEAFGSAGSGQLTKNVPFKIALGFETNNVAGFANGTQAGSTDTSVDIPLITIPEMNCLLIGGSNGGRLGSGNNHHGHIRKVYYYPQRLTNAELQALTEND
jgi:hypothetical protein